MPAVEGHHNDLHRGLPRVMGAIEARFAHEGERVGQVEARVSVAGTRVEDHSHKIGALQRELQELRAFRAVNHGVG